MLRIIGKGLVFLLSAWALFLSICILLNINIIFPFEIIQDNELPFYRMQALRLAIFMTFIFYGVSYLINTTKEVYPLHFLKVFLISFGIGLFVMNLISPDTVFKDYVITFFILMCGIIFHLISKPQIKKYFS